MTREHFLNQMNRLTDTYGKSAYGTERAKIIWNSVAELTEKEFSKVVDYLIGHFRQAPLMQEISEEVSKIRERRWNQQKLEHASEAKAFMSHLHDDEVKQICAQIRQRVSGQMSDDVFSQFMKHLNTLGRI